MESGYHSSNQHSEDFSYPSAPPPPCACPCHTCSCSCYRRSGIPLHPPPTPMHPVGRWNTGLCDMAADLNNCVWTCFCPCITFGHNVAALDQGHTTSCRQAGCIWVVFLLIGLPCFCSAQWRKRLRKEFAIPGGECGDHCLHLWCGPCALCQEFRELKFRGRVPATSTSSAPTAPQQASPMNRNQYPLH